MNRIHSSTMLALCTSTTQEMIQNPLQYQILRCCCPWKRSDSSSYVTFLLQLQADHRYKDMAVASKRIGVRETE